MAAHNEVCDGEFELRTVENRRAEGQTITMTRVATTDTTLLLKTGRWNPVRDRTYRVGSVRNAPDKSGAKAAAVVVDEPRVLLRELE